MYRGLDLWNLKEITTTLTAPGTVGRDIWSKLVITIKNAVLENDVQQELPGLSVVMFNGEYAHS